MRYQTKQDIEDRVEDLNQFQSHELTAKANRELAELKEFLEWHYYDIKLIHEWDWMDYVRGLAEDISNLDSAVWSFTCIDWNEAANELANDYEEVELSGHTYYVRERFK